MALSRLAAAHVVHRAGIPPLVLPTHLVVYAALHQHCLALRPQVIEAPQHAHHVGTGVPRARRLPYASTNKTKVVSQVMSVDDM